ncbi:MAG: EpsG family protein [Clostridia bacterium]|nr:EpsG family protein [Clostridia bacterium]MBR3592475.1 EpsG family protein [Clostridia bacterium]
MTTYFIVIFLIIIFAYFAQKNIIKKAASIANEFVIIKPTMTKMFFIFIVGVLVFVAGFRYYVGTDYGAYYGQYLRFANSFWESLKNFDEPGYGLIALISLKLNLGGEGAIFIAAALTNIIFLITIYKNTDMLFPATLFYIFLGCWHGGFNGVRQYLASAIIFSGLRFIKERKFWKYALVVFIAFLFHGSAIMMIFPYFVVYNKISFKNIAFLIGLSLIILFSFSEVLEFTGFLLQEDLSDEGEYLTNSVNTFRILVAIAPALFFLFLYQKRTITKEQQFWFNMLILNGIVMFATSNSTYLARVGIYTVPFSTIGIPELIKGSNIKQKKAVTIIILVAFAAFWLYELSNSDGLNNFRFIFNNV